MSLEIQKRYSSPDEAQADILARLTRSEVVMGFGHPVYTIADPRHQVIKAISRELSEEAKDFRLFDIADRIESVMSQHKRCSRTSTGSQRWRIT